MFAKFGAALVAGTLCLSALPTMASAASPITAAFLANAVPNVDFLARSSRLAAKAAPRAALRAFARTEAADADAAAASLDEYVRAERAAQAVLAQMAAEGEPLQTGRSVAVEVPEPPLARKAAILTADTRQPLGAADLGRLSGLAGAAFDAAYRTRQLTALRQLAADYEAYIAAGDDPLLLGVAGRELPHVRRAIATLAKS